MVQRNNTQFETAFTVSVDDVNCTTGISAMERDMTIRRLANPISTAKDLLRPGHIFPLIAQDGGVLVRTGHTEASVDICKLSGVAPVGVICEIMKDDGEMARRDDLQQFAKTHQLKTIYVSDIIEYRLMQQSLVEKVEEKPDMFLEHSVQSFLFRDHLDKRHTAYIFGENIEAKTYVKFHHIGQDIELFRDNKKFQSLMNAIAFLKDNGGILIFLDKDSNDHYAPMKNFGIGAQIIQQLGIKEIHLLTADEVSHDFVSIKGFGLDIVERVCV